MGPRPTSAVLGGTLLGGLLLLACDRAAPVEDPVQAALEDWPTEPGALADHCPTLPFPELVTTCRVQAAATFAAAGQTAPAEEICAALAPGTWQEECHFRVGEELAHAGLLAPAVRHCGQAGWFARNCVTHSAWRMTLAPGVGPGTDVAALEAEGSELLSVVEAGLGLHEDPGVLGEGRHVFLAAWGLHVYLGTGRTDPAPASLAGEVGAALRTGFATEAARLLTPAELDPAADPVAALLATWRGDQIRTGDPLPEARRGIPEKGRWHTPVLGRHDAGLPHLPLYGGGLRLVGETPEEDATIAILEALYWREESPAALFLPHLDDPRVRVRWTATKLAALAARTPGGLPDEARQALLAATVDEQSREIVEMVGRR